MPLTFFLSDYYCYRDLFPDVLSFSRDLSILLLLVSVPSSSVSALSKSSKYYYPSSYLTKVSVFIKSYSSSSSNSSLPAPFRMEISFGTFFIGINFLCSSLYIGNSFLAVFSDNDIDYSMLFEKAYTV